MSKGWDSLQSISSSRSLKTLPPPADDHAMLFRQTFILRARDLLAHPTDPTGRRMRTRLRKYSNPRTGFTSFPY